MPRSSRATSSRSVGRGGGEALAHASCGGCRRAPGGPVSGSTSHRSPTRHQLLLARVDDLDRQHAVARPQRAQRALPVARAAEVGDDDHEPALAPQRGDALQRVAERGRARAVGLGRRGAARPAAPSSPSRPWRGRSMRGSPAPNASTPSRLPRRVATWPTASATPSATSVLRRSAVPNVIEADTSSTSQAVSARSPTCTRTCGSLQPRGDVPVDVADVVAREVRPDHRQLGAAAHLRRQVLAGDQALDPPHHREVEVAQDRLRDGAGARLGRRCAPARAGRCAPHGSRPPRAMPKPAPASSSTSAPPANADVTWRFSLKWASRVLRLRVDRAQLLRVGRGEELAAGVAGDVLQRQRVRRHLLERHRAGPLVHVAQPPVRRAERDRVDRDLVLLGLLDDVDRVRAAGARRRRTAARSPPAAGASRRARPAPARARRRAPGGMPSPIAVPPATFIESIAAITRGVVGRRLDQLLGAGAERDQAEPELVRHLARRTCARPPWPRPAGSAGRRWPVIEPEVSITQHHRRLVPLGGDRALRAGDRDQQRGQREQRRTAPAGGAPTSGRPTAASRSTFV